MSDKKFDFNKLTGALGMVGNSISAYTSLANTLPNNTYQDDIDSLNYSTVNANSFDDLQNQFNNTNWAKTNYNYSDIDPMTGGQAAGQILGSGVQGAIEGAAAFGPWGALKGVLDMGIAGVGYGVRRNKAKRQMNELSNNAITANQNVMNKMQNSAMNIGKNNTNNALLNSFANGGMLQDLFSNGVRKIEEGGSHEQNPYDGVQQGIASDGLPNLVEEGEVIFDDYVYSRRLNVPSKDKEMLGLKKKKQYSYADAAEEIQKESEERPNDPLSKQNLKVMMSRLQQSQEDYKAKREQDKLRKAYNEMTPDEQAALLSMAMGNAQQMQQQVPQQQFAKGGHLYDNGGLFGTIDKDGKWIPPGADPNNLTERDKELMSLYSSPVEYARDYFETHEIDDLNAEEYAHEVTKSVFNAIHRKEEEKVQNMYDNILSDILKGYYEVPDPHYVVNTPKGDATWDIDHAALNEQADKDDNERMDELTTVTDNSGPNTDSIIYQRPSAPWEIGYREKEVGDDENPTQYSLPPEQQQRLIEQLNEESDEMDKERMDELTKKGLSKYQYDFDKDVKSILGFNPFPDPDGQNGGSTTPPETETETGITPPNTSKSDLLKTLSVAGTVGNAIKSLFDTPDYSNIQRAERAMSAVRPVSSSPIGERLTYNPMDVNYVMNNIVNASLGNRRLAAENSLGNISLMRNNQLANNYGLSTGIGSALNQAKTANDKLLNDVIAFNRGTSQYNSTQNFDAAKTNQALGMNKANFLYQTGQLRDAEKARLQATQGTNMTAALQSLNGLGDDVWNKTMQNWLAQNGYYEWMNVPGNRTTTPGTQTATNGKYGGKLKKGGKHA